MGLADGLGIPSNPFYLLEFTPKVGSPTIIMIFGMFIKAYHRQDDKSNIPIITVAVR